MLLVEFPDAAVSVWRPP